MKDQHEAKIPTKLEQFKSTKQKVFTNRNQSIGDMRPKKKVLDFVANKADLEAKKKRILNLDESQEIPLNLIKVNFKTADRTCK